MRWGIALVAAVAPAAFAKPYHYHDHFVRNVAIGAAIRSTVRPPILIAPVPLGALTPSGPGSSQVGPLPVADEIGKMAALRDRGILTNEEFQQEKTKLLGAPQ